MQSRRLEPKPADEFLSSTANSHLTNGQRLRVPSRSPHPYHRRRADGPHVLESASGLRPPSSNASPVHSEMEREVESSESEKGKRGKQPVMSPSESGTEADDEGYGSIKALPAPPLRPRKGLRDTRGAAPDGITSPLLTPTALDQDTRRSSFDSTSNSRKADNGRMVTDEERRAVRAKSVRRRRAEILRRASELALLVAIGVAVLSERLVWHALQRWHRAEFLAHLSIVLVLFLLYPIRLVAYAWKRTAPRILFWQSIRIPASFDPAPLLYPVFLPVLVAISLLPAFPKAALPNAVLGLATLPPQLIPGIGNEPYSLAHWLISVLPLFVSENTDVPSRVVAVKPYMLKTPPPEGLQPEIIASLFPLHQALLPLLHYLTTTSLLPTELHILSVSLINLYLFADSPQTVILGIILWVGGLGLFVSTAPIIRWTVALARVPRWRFRRAGRIIQARQSFVSSLNQALTRRRSASHNQLAVQSDADDSADEGADEKPRLSLDTLKEELLGSLKTNILRTGDSETQSAVEPMLKAPSAVHEKPNGSTIQSRRRRYTLPTNLTGPRDSPKRRGIRLKSSRGHAFSSLTPQQAAVRKWMYAGYVYLAMALLILGPIRSLIARYALNGHEPFGWAIGYLFGNIRDVRFSVVKWDLSTWIPLPPLRDDDYSSHLNRLGRAERLRQLVLGEANSRLWIAAYCLVVLAIGMITVLRLSAVVEVDTRRKVFHGMMVAMLLPTTFIDPTFIALALGLILAIFLILDLLRASQMPPLSKPLAYFLTPYVDGRDLRGPVVVSHIFLLIGCAVPLWLSLASATTFGDEPWTEWEVRSRDMSMLAGVVCVGMGDAAASLIGRRFGRTKWPWSGGKSLEGSAAFALAVTAGLTFGKAWLRLGQWNESAGGAGVSWLTTVLKAGVSGCGASLLEAVLTGGNDNVVVPVALWLLVRAVGV